MPSLPNELFSPLESKTIQAREAAEKAARNVIQYLGVENERWTRSAADERKLWLALRARARQFGGSLEDENQPDLVKRGLPQLMEEIAYEQWHRMLFARFLAENGLLIHPVEQVAVTLEDCEQLAPDEGEDDAWRLAARYASAMLPELFRMEDPCAQARLTPSDHHALESILLSIPAAVFGCDDALGWMYQFWQSKKKDEVNASGRKIGGADLSPVTQLFTEDYMVRFLLENSLGAWWAARHPLSLLIKDWEYLRFNDDGTPAAGAFLSWPHKAAEVTVMDPCCGSGHFLVLAFEMLSSMRGEEEGLDPAAAAEAVLRDNLFGLELDPRCTQIAGFSLALAAWKRGGYRPLPELNLACSGLPVRGQLADWLKLAGGDERLKGALERLYRIFQDAPDLGSLIDPIGEENLLEAGYQETIGLLRTTRSVSLDEPANLVFGITAQGLYKAMELLASKYILVATNVPYRKRSDFNDVLKSYTQERHENSKSNLATCFLERCTKYCRSGGTISIVTIQNWIFQPTYAEFRRTLLTECDWRLIAKLGLKAFKTPMWDFNTALFIISTRQVVASDICCIDVSDKNGYHQKKTTLKVTNFLWIRQAEQLRNPEYRIAFEKLQKFDLLEKYADSYQGLKTGDDGKLRRFFWEVMEFGTRWRYLQSTVGKSIPYGGLEGIIDWYESGKDMARLQGKSAWRKQGIAVSQMSGLPCSLYSGAIYDSNMSALIPKQGDLLSAIWYFCQSRDFRDGVKNIDQSLKVTNSALLKVPFDLAYWQRVADEAGLLPGPHSGDPTQWLFNGHPVKSEAPLQVAMVRLLGYRWPQQAGDTLADFADNDGIACLPAVNGEPPAAERLRGLLATAYGADWSPARQEMLLAEVGFAGKDLGAWLRDAFFEQHYRLFHNRPFIWHIWDGHRDGFSALVNYHKLDRANLEKLAYSYLGAWLRERRRDMDAGAAGAEGRYLAAKALQDKLKLILEGEPPYDIYVRWKPLDKQPLGWEPDLNDGVRLNIRPFVAAGVLRAKFTINWNKDRGKNPDGSERLNDLHFTLPQKRAVREQ